MSKSHRFVGVTFGELAAWHASGETRLLHSRLIDVPTDSEAPALSAGNRFTIRTLLQRLPPLSLDDEEGVLVMRLASGQLSHDEDDSQLVRISMDLVEGVVPLTERARQILIVRLEDYGITPEKAWFEEEFRELSYKRRVQSSVRAGNELVRIAVSSTQQVTTNRLEGAAARALAIKDFDGPVAVSDDPASVPETWIEFAFGWTRHDSYDHGALNHLYDAGGVLKKLLTKNSAAISTDAFAALRESGKVIVKKFGDRARFDEILRCTDFVSAALAIKAAAPDVFPAGLCALVLYLRWQEQFHNAGSSIDFGCLSEDLDDLARLSINHTDIVAAVWLLGYYAGCERVAPLVYAKEHARFRWFRGQPLVVSGADTSNSNAGGPDARKDPAPVVAPKSSGLGLAGGEQPNGGAGSETAADGDGSLAPENPRESSTVDRDRKPDEAAAVDGPVGRDETNKQDKRSPQTDAKETCQPDLPLPGMEKGYAVGGYQGTGKSNKKEKGSKKTTKKQTPARKR